MSGEPSEIVVATELPSEAVYGAFSEEVPEAPVQAAQDPLDVAMDVAMGHANWQFLVFSDEESEELTKLPLEEAVTGVNSGVVVTEAMGGTLTESLAFSGMSQERNPQESLTYEQLFRSVASTYSLDWRLLAAVAYRESRFNPLAVGSQGELGLMQILPSTWNSLAPSSADPFDPVTNVHVGAMYLASLHGRAWGLLACRGL